MYFSKSTNGFYRSDIHGKNMPADVVEITAAAYQDLLHGNTQGREIISGPDGYPTLTPIVTPTLEDLKAIKLQALAKQRYEVETGGITFNGALINTARDSQAMLTGAWVRVQQQPLILIDWKTIEGWKRLGKTEIETLAATVSTHVQACFTAESIHAGAINQLDTEEELNAYDITTGWSAVEV